MQSLVLLGGNCLRASRPRLFAGLPSGLLLNARTLVRPAQTLGAVGAHLHASPSVLKPMVPYHARYSTRSAPPPPPPPPSTDKNAKGRVLLGRISRAFTFSLSSVLVLGAAGVALLVVYLILSELFLPSGDTRTFNKAIKLVEKSEVAQQLLGFQKGDRLKAYGETGGDKWVRNRPVHGLRSKGQDGSDHLLMKFHVESDSGKHGSVVLEQVDTSFWSSEFAYIALDVSGAKRVYVIEPKFQSKSYVPKINGGNGFLGLKWGPKKDE